MSRTPAEATSVADGPTIASTRDYWSLHLRSEGKSERTILTYQNALRQLDEFLADQGMPRALRAIRREHIEAWVVGMQQRGHKPSTVSIAFRSVRPFFRWLVEEDEIERSPMDKMRAPSVPVNPPAVLDEQDVERLLKACAGTDFDDRRDLAILMLMMDTGLRRGELAAIRLRDVNLPQGVAFIEASTSKSRRGRVVPFGVGTAKALMRYLRHPRAPHGEEQPMWLGRTGVPLTGNGILQMVRRRARQAGLRVHPHQLRHTWASSMLSSGHSEGDTMMLGGWASREMLSRYGASAAAERARAAYRSPLDALGRRR